MKIVISSGVLEKLQEKHHVDKREIQQCFENRVKGYLKDTREEHLTDPPTMWFIAETNAGLLLKIAFVPVKGDVIIKTAYEPNKNELSIYSKYAI